MFGTPKAQLTTRPLLVAALLLFILLVNVQAQSGRPAPTPQRPDRGVLLGSSTMQVELPTPIAETPVPLVGGARGGLQTLSFTTPDANFERVLVKGSAFSADSLTEHFQTLADGNRMGRRFAAHIYRDAAGRTRREYELGANSLAPDGQPPREIVINDPVGRVRYVINTQTGTARKMILPPAQVMEAMQRARGDNAPFSVLMPTSTAHRRKAEGDAVPPPPKPVKEQLPAQTNRGRAGRRHAHDVDYSRRRVRQRKAHGNHSRRVVRAGTADDCGDETQRSALWRDDVSADEHSARRAGGRTFSTAARLSGRGGTWATRHNGF